MHTYGNLEYTKDEIDVGGASTSSYIHPYGYRATHRAEIYRQSSLVRTHLRSKTDNIVGGNVGI